MAAMKTGFQQLFYRYFRFGKMAERLRAVRKSTGFNEKIWDYP